MENYTIRQLKIDRKKHRKLRKNLINKVILDKIDQALKILKNKKAVK